MAEQDRKDRIQPHEEQQVLDQGSGNRDEDVRHNSLIACQDYEVERHNNQHESAHYDFADDAGCNGLVGGDEWAADADGREN